MGPADPRYPQCPQLLTKFLRPFSLVGDMYRLTHGFRRYTGNIPEVLMSTTRGCSPRAVLISTKGISLYTF